MLTVHKCSDTRLFEHLSNTAYSILYFQTEITPEAQLLFESISNFTQITEMQKEFEKIFFGFEMIVFELVALNTRFY